MPEAKEKKRINYTRPQLAQYQLDAIFCKERYSWIEASTKSGKTHGCLAWLFERAALRGRPGRAFWWVAPVYPQAEIAYRRLKLAIPEPLRKCNETALTISLPNGGTIWFKTGEKPDNLYGDDVYDGVIDEGSRLREEAFYAVRSTLTKTNGHLRIIGNIKGRKNWFYTMCRKAQAGEANHKFSRISAGDAVKAGIITKEEVEDAKRTLPAAVFRELFECEPNDDGGNPFGQNAVLACVRDLSSLEPVAFGVDLAKSVDYTVIIGLDKNGQVCRFERFQAPWTETMDRVQSIVENVPCFLDSTGVGDPILEALQREKGENFEGYKFSSESKQKLMEGLAVAIQRGEITFPDGPIVNELSLFEYEYTRSGVKYSAPAGAHDDAVCALALAVAKKTQTWIPLTIPAVRSPYMGNGEMGALEGLSLG